jgi:hypothetical protein
MEVRSGKRRNNMADGTNILAAELVTAVVWSDGKNATIFFNWQEGPHVPPADWERAGDLIVVVHDENSCWTRCLRFDSRV